MELKHDELLTNFACFGFNCNLRHYTEDALLIVLQMLDTKSLCSLCITCAQLKAGGLMEHNNSQFSDA